MDTPIISHKRARKPEDYHALAEKRGMRWIGPYTGYVTDKTTWQCSKGHLFEMPYSILQKVGYGCTKCSRVQPEDYHTLARSRGFVWIGPFVRSGAEKTTWQCASGHRWDISYTALKGCPQCKILHAGDTIRHGADDYRQLAADRGLEWIGQEVTNIGVRTGWRCSRGHEFLARYSTIRRGNGCYKCKLEERSERNRIKPIAYHALAQSRGFEWLGPETQKTNEKTWWVCGNGHKWFAPYETLFKGSNCPECQGLVNGRRVSKAQVALCDMVGGELNYKIGRCTVDIALTTETKRIAIEYDCYYWHAKTQANDRRRAQHVINRGWKVLVVKSSMKLPTIDQLQDAFRILEAGESYFEIVLDDWGKVSKVNERRYIAFNTGTTR